jgi:esterase/lipase superfamily enzyme
MPMRSLSPIAGVAVAAALWAALWLVPGCEEKAAAPPKHGALPTATPPEVAAKKYKTVDVLYGTDRPRTGDSDPYHFYGVPEKGTAGQLEYGWCRVSIPPGHVRGALESRRWLIQDWDPNKHVALLELTPFAGEAEALQWLKVELAGSKQQDVLVYVHGFNNTFPYAVRRIAQLAHDLGFNGVPVAYSWPSQATTGGYTADEATAERSWPRLKEFLHTVALKSGATRVHIIAHSMGSRLISRALADLNAESSGAGPVYRQLILAAPDIDESVFRDQIADRLSWVPTRVTLYACSEDLALCVSEQLHADTRLGRSTPPLCIINGVETIDTSTLARFFDTNHDIFASQSPVLNDIFYLINNDLGASKRDLEQVQSPTGTYWRIKTPSP